MAQKVIDLHCDSVYSLMEGKDLRQRQEGIHLDLPRLREGRVALQVFAVFIPPEGGYISSGGLGPIGLGNDKPFEYTSKRLDAIEAFARLDDLLIQVETGRELKACMAADKTGVMAAIENGLAIEESIEKLEKFRRRKVRIMTLVHSQHLSWIASCTGKEPFSAGGTEGSGNKNDQSRAPGLSEFGGKVVDAMNDLGIIPDLSHA